jgi:hypothetical protein
VGRASGGARTRQDPADLLPATHLRLSRTAKTYQVAEPASSPRRTSLAGACKSRMFTGVSFLSVAPYCTALRSRWCQSGINITSCPPKMIIHPWLS